MSGLRGVVIEPWYGGSHRAWADGLVAHSTHELTLLTHPASGWRWRLRGSALTLAAALTRHVALHGRPDLLVVSGMTDLARLCGLARHVLGDVPVGLYLHENQLAFPAQEANEPTHDQAYVTWLSMAAADAVWCNSAYHRAVLAGALTARLADAPDLGHGSFVDDVLEHTSVLPVGVDVAGLVNADRSSEHERGTGPPLVVWNQRWDHDKDPARLLGILVHLAEAGVAFRVALAGENRRVDPREFRSAIERLGDRVVHVGHLPGPDYRALLLRSDVVVSTARHEFFGVAVVEAVAAGAVPLLPDRLSYPELIPSEHHATCLYDGHLHDRLRDLLLGLDAVRPAVADLRGSMARFDWSVTAPAYDRAFEQLVTGHRGPAWYPQGYGE